jgi:hypothetical protein
MLHISLLTKRILLLTVSFHLYPRKLTFSTLKVIIGEEDDANTEETGTALLVTDSE